MGRSVGGIDLNSCFSQLFIRHSHRHDRHVGRTTTTPATRRALEFAAKPQLTSIPHSRANSWLQLTARPPPPHAGLCPRILTEFRQARAILRFLFRQYRDPRTRFRINSKVRIPLDLIFSALSFPPHPPHPLPPHAARRTPQHTWDNARIGGNPYL